MLVVNGSSKSELEILDHYKDLSDWDVPRVKYVEAIEQILPRSLAEVGGINPQVRTIVRSNLLSTQHEYFEGNVQRETSGRRKYIQNSPLIFLFIQNTGSYILSRHECNQSITEAKSFLT